VKRKREKIEEEFRKEVEKTAECIMYYPDSSSSAIINLMSNGTLIYKTSKITTYNLRLIPLKVIIQGIEEIKDKIGEGV
jgi:hypothetical protein